MGWGRGWPWIACFAGCIAVLVAPGPAQAAFGLSGGASTATNSDGTLDSQAGSHPYAYTFSFVMNKTAEGEPEGQLRGATIELPAGLIGNTSAVDRCTRQEFEGGTPGCRVGAQIGIVRSSVEGQGQSEVPLYNL